MSTRFRNGGHTFEDDLHLIVGIRVHQLLSGLKAVESSRDGLVCVLAALIRPSAIREYLVKVSSRKTLGEAKRAGFTF
jgi:hypothetical protein